jgi:hypothetical protein
MGFFSWKTQDTDKSIANKYSIRSTFRVQMMDDKGNVWTENDYDGYGEFGGKDYYELLAEMNGVHIDKDIENYSDKMRMAGIDLAFNENPMGIGTEGVKYPNLVEMADGWRYDPIGPENCEYQGFFYDEETDEDDFFDEDENE